MNPTRRRRLWFVLALVLAAGVSTTLVAMALQRNIAADGAVALSIQSLVETRRHPGW